MLPDRERPRELAWSRCAGSVGPLRCLHRAVTGKAQDDPEKVPGVGAELERDCEDVNTGTEWELKGPKGARLEASEHLRDATLVTETGKSQGSCSGWGVRS